MGFSCCICLKNTTTYCQNYQNQRLFWSYAVHIASGQGQAGMPAILLFVGRFFSDDWIIFYLLSTHLHNESVAFIAHSGMFFQKARGPRKVIVKYPMNVWFCFHHWSDEELAFQGIGNNLKWLQQLEQVFFLHLLKWIDLPLGCPWAFSLPVVLLEYFSNHMVGVLNICLSSATSRNSCDIRRRLES